MRADTSDVAFRLFMALGDLWDGLQRASIDPGTRGLHLTKEYLGGYTRYSAGPAAHARMVVEWNEATRHLRVVRCENWNGFEAVVCSTVAHVREQARSKGLGEIVEARLNEACKEPAPARRTVVTVAASLAAVAPVRTGR